MPKTYWLETLGCPKNQVDSDKLEGKLQTDGVVVADSPESADLVLVNTCAFIESARQESMEVIQELGERRKSGAQLVVTGCMAERYGEDLSNPTIDAIAGFGVPVTLKSSSSAPPSFDLLNLPRPPAKAPWSYLKVAEGCDRKCGYCAIPSFRGAQRSRNPADIIAELESLDVQEVVLVAQDLAAYGRDKSTSTSSSISSSNSKEKPIINLVREIAERVKWVRLLYLYPSDLTEDLISAILDTQVPYFDLSLQHASRPLLKNMRRFGSGEIFSRRIAEIRERAPEAVFRSNFIVGYPGETEADHEELLEFIEAAELDWGSFFLYSEEAGTHSEGLEGKVAYELASQRRAEVQTLQLEITEAKRDQLVGERVQALIQSEGEARTFREAPEIDGIIHVPQAPNNKPLKIGTFVELEITGSSGCDLHGVPTTTP